MMQTLWALFLILAMLSPAGTPALAADAPSAPQPRGMLRGEGAAEGLLPLDEPAADEEEEPSAGQGLEEDEEEDVPVLFVELSLPEALLAGIPRKASAGVSGGTGPYAFRWTLDGESLSGTEAEVVLPALAPGTYLLRVQALDGEGIAGAAEASLEVAEAPQMPEVALGVEVSKKGLTATASVTAGAPPYALAWSLDGKALDGEEGEQLTLEGLAPGLHWLRVEVTDAEDLVRAAVARVDVLEQAGDLAGAELEAWLMAALPGAFPLQGPDPSLLLQRGVWAGEMGTARPAAGLSNLLYDHTLEYAPVGSQTPRLLAMDREAGWALGLLDGMLYVYGPDAAYDQADPAPGEVLASLGPAMLGYDLAELFAGPVEEALLVAQASGDGSLVLLAQVNESNGRLQGDAYLLEVAEGSVFRLEGSAKGEGILASADMSQILWRSGDRLHILNAASGHTRELSGFGDSLQTGYVFRDGSFFLCYVFSGGGYWYDGQTWNTVRSSDPRVTYPVQPTVTGAQVQVRSAAGETWEGALAAPTL